jgi:hypothetical protein
MLDSDRIVVTMNILSFTSKPLENHASVLNR